MCVCVCVMYVWLDLILIGTGESLRNQKFFIQNGKISPNTFIKNVSIGCFENESRMRKTRVKNVYLERDNESAREGQDLAGPVCLVRVHLNAQCLQKN